MSGATSKAYQHACERAELLGQPTPTEEEWLASEERAREMQKEETEAHDDAAAEELEDNEENMKRIGGGLEELNSILNATQKKINKFKTVCGSLGTLLKARVSSQPGTPEHKPNPGSSSKDPMTQQENPNDETINIQEEDNDKDEKEVAKSPRPASRKTDMNQKMCSQIDKLDSLITKAENAQYSMKHQTKQMRTFVN